MANRVNSAVIYWLENSLYLNITNQCSNNCWYCFRNFKQGVDNFNLKLAKEPDTSEIISELKQFLPGKHWNEAVFCGFGEPTARLDVLLEISRWIKKNYPNIPIRLDTNGHGYALNKGRDVAKELKDSGFSKTSVSLNGHNKETYNENCRPRLERGFEAVLEFIQKAKASDLEVEVSAVRMPEVDIQKVKALTEVLGVPLRIRDYIPCFW